jgi:hypothetical protein
VTLPPPSAPAPEPEDETEPRTHGPESRNLLLTLGLLILLAALLAFLL